MTKVTIALIFALAFSGFAYHSSPNIYKSLVEYLKSQSGGCACSDGSDIFGLHNN